MKILLFTLFVATVSAGSFKVGTIKCTYGPAYWCKNLKQAKECNAVQHCQEKVWKQNKVSSNETCTACVDALTTVKSLLTNPDIEKQLIAYLDEACSFLGGFASECKTLVDQYGNLVLQELAQLLDDPKAVCTELGLCSASKKKIITALLHKALPVVKSKVFSIESNKKHAKNILKAVPVKASAECVLCEFVAQELDSMLSKNSTQQEIKAALDKVCSIMPSSIRTECTEFVDEYAPEILQILAQEINPQMICTTLGVCTTKTQMKKLKANGEVCEICSLAVSYLKNMLKDNKTDEEIINELKQLCSQLPSQIGSECTTIVSEYGMMLLQIIANTDAQTICTEIGLCSSKVKQLDSVSSMKDKCMLGASYWCASHANAVKCNATSFCKKHPGAIKV